jgi:dTDP-4-amino-4,6-dideoxygalactose transaminase
MTTGEGGMVTTDDAAVADKVRRLINHGRTDSYEHAEIGYNYRMTNMQAAIGLEQLNRLPDWVQQRRANASRLTAGLDGCPGIETPVETAARHHAYHQYTVRTSDRSSLQTQLSEHDVGYGVYYPRTIPQQPAYDDEPYDHAETAASEVLSLPVHPQLSDGDIDRVVETVRSAVEVSP